ncbi:MAG: hypothetical protein M1828_007454 [Chrysothrix sp. TS-e1954]|nr:MAG: hypothetical protein M1828_007454 [Chrysothrix sp. TS-e1954]
MAPEASVGVEVARPLLFSGLSFYVLQRVPSRSIFVHHLEANGGTIARVESAADLVIADHLRRDSPEGAVSFTWIEQSVKDGILASRDEHRAGRAAATPRPVAASTPAAKGRQAYTKEDDAILYSHVMTALKRGGVERGNDIYKELGQRVGTSTCFK